MSNILVTGGAGFIGSNLIKRLVVEGHSIICLDNYDPFYSYTIKLNNVYHLQSYPNFQLIEGSILNKMLLDEIISSNNVDVIIHLAAKAGVRPSLNYPVQYFDTNVIGTINILEAMKNYKVKKMIFASSSSVYGDSKKVPYKETDITDSQVSPYAASKKSAENVCSTYASLYDLNISVLRFFSVYGPRQRPDMAIASFTKRILSNAPITLYDGDGYTARDYTYVDDIVEGITNNLECINGYEVYNLGSTEITSLIDLVKVIEEVTSKKADIKFAGRQKGDVTITYSNIQKAEKAFNYRPKIKIVEGIEHYYKWLIKNKSVVHYELNDL